MSKVSMNTVLRLLALSAAFEHQFSPVLGSVHSLSLTEFLFLQHLSQAPLGRMRRVDVASLMNLGQSSVTRLSAPLEGEGLLARESDARDARVVYSVVTEAGRVRAREAAQTLDRLSAGIFDDRWSDEEIALLFKFLGRVGRSVPTGLG